ncbi:MAG: T9SS type A sorting domain-containing protein [Chitinophagales bacterium]
MKNFCTCFILLFVVIHVFAQDCVNETIRGFTSDIYSPVEVCIEEVCGLGTDFQISKIKLTFTASTHTYAPKCFRYHTLPGFSGEDRGIATVCNDAGECSEVPVSFIVGVAPDCLPDTIEVDTDISPTMTEVCLEEYCSDLGELNFTVLNPSMWTYEPMRKGDGLCLEHYSLPGSGTYQETYDVLICNDETYTYCDSLTLVFNIDNPTAIEGFEENDFIKVYPNPATDFLHFSLPLIEGKSNDFKALLYDAQGREVLQNTFRTGSQKESYSIDISELSLGVYFLKIYTSTEKDLKAIGVQRILVK